MRWRVEILESNGGDRLLKDVFRKLWIDVVEEDGTQFLISERFEALDKHTEVHELASRVAATIEEVSKYDDELTLGLGLGSVIEEREDGSRRKHDFARLNGGVLATVGLTATLTVGKRQELSEEERKRLEEEQQEREYQQLSRRAISRVVSACTDSKALQVQRLLKGDLTPHTLGHIAEFIEDDLGGAIVSLASRNQWTRFSRSINHPAVFGEQARHVVTSQEPPPNPMTLGEAQLFIQKVANTWLEHKAGFSSA